MSRPARAHDSDTRTLQVAYPYDFACTSYTSRKMVGLNDMPSELLLHILRLASSVWDRDRRFNDLQSILCDLSMFSVNKRSRGLLSSLTIPKCTIYMCVPAPPPIVSKFFIEELIVSQCGYGETSFDTIYLDAGRAGAVDTAPLEWLTLKAASLTSLTLDVRHPRVVMNCSEGMGLTNLTRLVLGFCSSSRSRYILGRKHWPGLIGALPNLRSLDCGCLVLDHVLMATALTSLTYRGGPPRGTTARPLVPLQSLLELKIYFDRTLIFTSTVVVQARREAMRVLLRSPLLCSFGCDHYTWSFLCDPDFAKEREVVQGRASKIKRLTFTDSHEHRVRCSDVLASFGGDGSVLQELNLFGVRNFDIPQLSGLRSVTAIHLENSSLVNTFRTFAVVFPHVLLMSNLERLCFKVRYMHRPFFTFWMPSDCASVDDFAKAIISGSSLPRLVSFEASLYDDEDDALREARELQILLDNISRFCELRCRRLR